jgi:protein-tyrosine phosphatase
MPAGERELTRERALAAAARIAEPWLGRLLRAAPIRRVLHRRAMVAWRATDEPLALCFGNINRSPFAAALARRRPGSRAGSAGFYPQAGRPSPPSTVAGARARGVELDAHRSVIVSDEQLAGAPAIFIFDLENLARVAARRAGALRRTHFLGALAPAGAVLIADPHGRGQAMLEDVLSEIQRAVEHADLTQGNAVNSR